MAELREQLASMAVDVRARISEAQGLEGRLQEAEEALRAARRGRKAAQRVRRGTRAAGRLECMASDRCELRILASPRPQATHRHSQRRAAAVQRAAELEERHRALLGQMAAVEERARVAEAARIAAEATAAGMEAAGAQMQADAEARVRAMAATEQKLVRRGGLAHWEDSLRASRDGSSHRTHGPLQLQRAEADEARRVAAEAQAALESARVEVADAAAAREADAAAAAERERAAAERADEAAARLRAATGECHGSVPQCAHPISSFPLTPAPSLPAERLSEAESIARRETEAARTRADRAEVEADALKGEAQGLRARIEAMDAELGQARQGGWGRPGTLNFAVEAHADPWAVRLARRAAALGLEEDAERAQAARRAADRAAGELREALRAAEREGAEAAARLREEADRARARCGKEMAQVRREGTGLGSHVFWSGRETGVELLMVNGVSQSMCLDAGRASPQRMEASARVAELERALREQRAAADEVRRLAGTAGRAGPEAARETVAAAMDRARALAAALREAEAQRDAATGRVAEAQAALVRVQVRSTRIPSHAFQTGVLTTPMPHIRPASLSLAQAELSSYRKAAEAERASLLRQLADARAEGDRLMGRLAAAEAEVAEGRRREAALREAKERATAELRER